MKHTIRQVIVILAMGMLFSACATHVVKTTSYTPIVQDLELTDEELLLDIGITVFDPGLDEIEKRDEETTNHQIRVAEAPFAAFMMAETLQRSGNWGIVRVLPNNGSTMDVIISGTLLQSNGEEMTIRVNVKDSSGREWYTREYNEVVSRFSYDPAQRRQNDPFQVIYNNIANDLLEYRKDKLTSARILEVRKITELLFAQRFVPEVFDQYMSQDRDGYYSIARLPANNDPVLRRVGEIRERDFMFIDTVQDYYATYTRQMKLPYDSWREQSYHETIALRDLRASSTRRFVAGTAAVLGGIAAATQGGTYAAQNAGIVGVGAGAYLIKSGFDKRGEAQMHVAAIEELGISLENEVAPRVINLEDRTVTLTGNVEEQYSQWKEILADLYAADIGAQLINAQ